MLQSKGSVYELGASSTSHQWGVFLYCPVVTSLLEASRIQPNCLLKWSIPRHALNANHCVPYSRHRSAPHRWLRCYVVDSSTSGVCWSNPGTPDAIESRRYSPNIEHDANILEVTDLVVQMYQELTQWHATFVWVNGWAKGVQIQESDKFECERGRQLMMAATSCKRVIEHSSERENFVQEVNRIKFCELCQFDAQKHHKNVKH